MPKFFARLKHLHGKTVNVRGKKLAVGKDGVLEVSAEDAKLLEGIPREWQPVVPRPAAKAVEKPAEAPKKSEPPTPPSTPKEEEEGDEGQTKWEVPKDGEEWPDPVVEMPKKFLLKMAKAYEVELPSKATKEEIVEILTTAMFEETPGAGG